MKKLGFLGKFLLVVNSVFALALLIGYVLPYISPRFFPQLAVLALVLPALLVVNVLFLGYWLLRFRKQFVLSAVVLVLGFNHIISLYRFGNRQMDSPQEGLSVLSYNVRTFNEFAWSTEKDIPEQIQEFVLTQNPDVVCFQEFHPVGAFAKADYPYTHAKMVNRSKTFGQIIYSKYPIINSGSLDFEGTGNNAIYADIVKNEDTLRVYNVHFQSLSISPKFEHLQAEDSKRLLGRLGDGFKKQAQQAEQFVEHEKTSPYPVLVVGDFNNSASSYIYRKVKGDKTDAFVVAGKGTGRTYTFDFVPLRIDFVLVDPLYTVTHFKNYNVNFSDHRPVFSRVVKK